MTDFDSSPVISSCRIRLMLLTRFAQNWLGDSLVSSVVELLPPNAPPVDPPPPPPPPPPAPPPPPVVIPVVAREVATEFVFFESLARFM